MPSILAESGIELARYEALTVAPEFPAFPDEFRREIVSGAEHVLTKASPGGDALRRTAKAEVDDLATWYDMIRLELGSYPVADVTIERLALPHELAKIGLTAMPPAAGHMTPDSTGAPQLDQMAVQSIELRLRTDDTVTKALEILRKNIPNGPARVFGNDGCLSPIRRVYAHLQVILEERGVAAVPVGSAGEGIFSEVLERMLREESRPSGRRVVAEALARALAARRNVALRALAARAAGSVAIGAASAGSIYASYAMISALAHDDGVMSALRKCVARKVGSCAVVPVSATDVGPDPSCVKPITDACETAHGTEMNPWRAVGCLVGSFATVPTSFVLALCTVIPFIDASALTRAALQAERARRACMAERFAPQVEPNACPVGES